MSVYPVIRVVACVVPLILTSASAEAQGDLPEGIAQTVDPITVPGVRRERESPPNALAEPSREARNDPLGYEEDRLGFQEKEEIRSMCRALGAEVERTLICTRAAQWQD